MCRSETVRQIVGKLPVFNNGQLQSECFDVMLSVNPAGLLSINPVVHLFVHSSIYSFIGAALFVDETFETFSDQLSKSSNIS